MLVYECKNCKKFVVLGYINEFNEHFCNERCYKKYCKKNGYKANLDKLKEVDFP